MAKIHSRILPDPEGYLFQHPSVCFIQQLGRNIHSRSIRPTRTSSFHVFLRQGTLRSRYIGESVCIVISI
jgi:hypothetical protein